MADKTTTLKTKTNDNVYPNVIGDNMKNAFVDSSTITHHFYDKTHKVGFQIANETNIKIQNSLQKPAGLTKTKLVGVGTNGQENIEIGDNLTLANGKLSASGGGGDNVITITLNDSIEEKRAKYEDAVMNGKPWFFLTYLVSPATDRNEGSHGSYVMFDPDSKKLLYLKITPQYNETTQEVTFLTNDIRIDYMHQIYLHFITMTNSTDNVVLYLTIEDTEETPYTADDLYRHFVGHKVLAKGNLHGSVPTYIDRVHSTIDIHYMNPGDSNINPTPDSYSDLSSFTITDDVTPVE